MAAGIAIINSIAGIAQTQAQVENQRAERDLKESALRSEQRMQERRAKDAIERGRTAELRERQRTRKLIGAQRAAGAAQGIQIEEGSFAELLSETATLGAADAATIRVNASREALGFRLGAARLESQRRLERLVGKRRERTTLVTGGLRAVGDLQRFERSRSQPLR